jgi:ABC-type branched-subunit amino acid transport system substrate-binding protein
MAIDARGAVDRRWTSRGRHPSIVALGAVLALTVAACSVSEPRSGVAVRAGDAGGESAFGPGASETGSGGSGSEGAGVTGESGGVGSSGGVASGGATAPNEDGSAEVAGGEGASGGAGGSGGGEARTREVGVTTDSITISWMGGFSGATGQVTEDVYTGFLTWQADVNANGGIHGRQVVVKKIDHGDSPEGAVAACQEVLNNGSFTALFGSGGADLAVILSNCFEEHRFPNFYNYATAQKYKGWQYSFSMLTHPDDSLRAAVTFIKNKLGHGGEKLGLMCVNSASAKIECDAFIAEANAQGFELARPEYVEQNQAQFTSELLRLQQAGAEHITIHALLESVGILRDARAIQYNPHWTLGAFAFDFITQAGRSLYDGVTGLRNGATTDGPGFASYQEKAQKYGTTSAVPGEAQIVYAEGLIAGRAIEVAGPNPTHESLIAGLETNVRGWFNEISPPLTYTPEDHAGSHAAFPAVCCKPDWTWESLGPPAVSW